MGVATILTPLSIIRYLQKFLFCSEIFRWVNILKFDFVFIALRPIFMILSHLWHYFWINPASVDRHIYASVLKVVIFFYVIKLNMPPPPQLQCCAENLLMISLKRLIFPYCPLGYALSPNTIFLNISETKCCIFVLNKYVKRQYVQSKYLKHSIRPDIW